MSPDVRGHTSGGLPSLLGLFCCVVVLTSSATPATATPAAAPDLSATVVRVLGVEGGGWRRHTRLGLVVDSPGGQRPITWDDAAAVRCVEDANEIVFDDYVGHDIRSKHVRVVLRGYQRSSRDLVTQVRSINPRPDQQKDFTDVAALDPGDPLEDRTHHYVQVPVSYAHPELGTFRLYYEVNHDFDPSLATVMIPDDAQDAATVVGLADRYKKGYKLPCNVVTYQHRGGFASTVPAVFTAHGVDWTIAYKAFKMENSVEDMERIRVGLLGPEGRMNLFAGSGRAILSLAYLCKYPSHVDRAFLTGFFTNAQDSCMEETRFFHQFLSEQHLEDKLPLALRQPGVSPSQLFWDLNRLLYDDQSKARSVVETLSRGDLGQYREESVKTGSVDYVVHSHQVNWPQLVMFMYETGAPTAPAGEPDINEAILRIGSPVAELVQNGTMPASQLNIQQGIENIGCDVLIAVGDQDQVAPPSLQRAVYEKLPHARFVLAKGNHCLEDQRDFRRALLNAFLAHGSKTPEVDGVLHDPQWKDVVLETRP